ncbi:acyl-CoA dehydrogenase family protein [Actinocorallia longicatena]|uniref:Acyl-CoA dehydrogenase family protein n=1 Tax=Actinocorallia longicatena TaxID=111803 RepID=A0ABP6Q8B2_9ACTN
MNTELSKEAADYGGQASRALAAAGEDRAVAVLGELGAWDLDPRGDADDLEAAAALCRSAGYRAVDHPVADRLLPLGGPVTQAHLEPGGTADPRDVALVLTLQCWTLLGMLDRAIDLTREHVLVRRQFGRPLAEQQGVRFQLSDAEVERVGVEMLAAYALWSAGSGRPEAVDDALALRLAALEAAETVFRTAHVLHGALGFCDEAPLSWLSRRSQDLRRRPFGPSATRDLLARRIDGRGLTGLYSEENV